MECLRRADSGHRTNKAFERYNQAINEGAFEIFSKVRKVKKGEVVPFKKMRP
jgi:hypothetical protein